MIIFFTLTSLCAVDSEVRWLEGLEASLGHSRSGDLDLVGMAARSNIHLRIMKNQTNKPAAHTRRPCEEG